MAHHDENTEKSDIRVLESSIAIFYKAYFSWKTRISKLLKLAGPDHTQYVFLCELQSFESKHQKTTENDLARLTFPDIRMTSNMLISLQKRGLIELKNMVFRNGTETRGKYE